MVGKEVVDLGRLMKQTNDNQSTNKASFSTYRSVAEEEEVEPAVPVP